MHFSIVMRGFRLPTVKEERGVCATSLCMEQVWRRSAHISGREMVHPVRGRREPVEESRLIARTIESMCDRACAKARRADFRCLGGSHSDTSLFHRSLARPSYGFVFSPSHEKAFRRRLPPPWGVLYSFHLTIDCGECHDPPQPIGRC